MPRRVHGAEPSLCTWKELRINSSTGALPRHGSPVSSSRYPTREPSAITTDESLRCTCYAAHTASQDIALV